MSVSLSSGVRRDRAILWGVAGLLLAVLFYVAWRYVGTVVLGLFAYYVTRPVFQRIQRRLGNRTLSVAVSIFTVALPVLVLTLWAGIVAVQGVLDLASSQGFEQVQTFVEPYVDFSEIRDQFRTVFDQVVADPSRLTALEGNGLPGVVAGLLGSVALLFTVLIRLFVVLVIVFYLLRDGRKVAAWARDTVTPEGSVLEAYFIAVDRDLKNVYFGNILNALVTGLLGAIVYSLLNAVAPAAVTIPEPVLLGLLTGAASLVPVIGMKIVWVPIALLLLGDSLVTDPGTLWFPVLFAAVSTVVIDYIPDQLLRPYVSGRTLHVGAVMLAYVLGPLLFGWYGIFLGPLVLVVVFEFARIVVPWLVDPDRVVAAETARTTPSPESDATVTASVPAAMLVARDEIEPGPSEEGSDD